MRPGRKFSSMTSRWPISSSAAAWPSGVSMSSTTLFLLRLNVRKKPMPRPGSLRVLSPPGGSTLITSAPRSARIIPQVGPMTMCVNSTTRMPCSGSVGLSGSRGPPPGGSGRCASNVFGRPARKIAPCSASPCSHSPTCRAARTASRDRCRSRRPCSRACRRGLRSTRCRSRPAHAGSRRCRRAKHRSARCPLPSPRRRSPAQGRACRGNGRTRSGRPRSRSACSKSSRTDCRIGIADGVGDADAVGAGVEQRLQQPQHLVRRRRGPAACIRTPCRRRLRSASSSPRASRAARMLASSSTISSGVLRTLARLCAWLADSGTSSRSAPDSIARSAPLRFGTSTETNRPGSVFANATSSAVSASCGSNVAPARTSRPRSRAGRRRRRRGSTRTCARWAAIVAMLCSPSRRPTSRMTTRTGKGRLLVGHLGARLQLDSRAL